MSRPLVPPRQALSPELAERLAEGTRMHNLACLREVRKLEPMTPKERGNNPLRCVAGDLRSIDRAQRGGSFSRADLFSAGVPVELGRTVDEAREVRWPPTARRRSPLLLSRGLTVAADERSRIATVAPKEKAVLARDIWSAPCQP